MILNIKNAPKTAHFLLKQRYELIITLNQTQ